MHIKLLRNNCFLIISNGVGQMLYLKNAGVLGYKNINKRNIDVLIKVLSLGFAFIKSLLLRGDSFFIKVEGFNKQQLRLLNKKTSLFIKKTQIKIVVITISNKIAHNGCRKKLIRFS
jgi:ribosomal protein S11